MFTAGMSIESALKNAGFGGRFPLRFSRQEPLCTAPRLLAYSSVPYYPLLPFFDVVFYS